MKFENFSLTSPDNLDRGTYFIEHHHCPYFFMYVSVCFAHIYIHYPCYDFFTFSFNATSFIDVKSI